MKFDPAKEQDTRLLPHQERVNIEMFRAIKILGHKLENVETERDRLARRLALIESAATLDERTGKLYLPMAIDRGELAAPDQSAPRWMVVASLMSGAIAMLSLCIVLFRAPVPVPSALTPAQLAAINALTTPRFAQNDGAPWKAPAFKEEEKPEEQKVTAPVTQAASVPEETPEQTVLATAVDTPMPLPLIASSPTESTEQSAIEPAAGDSVPAQMQEVASAPPAPAIPVAEVQPVQQTLAPVVAKVEEAPPPPASVVADNAAPAVIAPDSSLPENLVQLEKHAFNGMPEAQHDLATLYASGRLAQQDYKRAAYWFNKAAEGGVANADYNLGVLFQQGLGVKQDVQKAIAWYEKAAELGHPEAMYNLGIAYVEGIGVTRNADKGIAYFKSAANAGVAQAAYNLGVLYESNFIGGIDLDKALEWYQVAADTGHAEAEAAASRLKAQLGNANAGEAALTVADLVDPTAAEETGEGDTSPASEAASASILITNVQNALIARDLLPPPATGLLDAKTQDAIRAFQTQSGIPPDGKPSEEVLEKIKAK